MHNLNIVQMVIADKYILCVNRARVLYFDLSSHVFMKLIGVMRNIVGPVNVDW